MVEKQFVWEFTNKKKLTKSEFLRYVDRKVFKNIRKYGMLSEVDSLTVEDNDLLSTLVLKHILEKKFSVSHSSNPVFLSDNLSFCAEVVMNNILRGDFSGPLPSDGKFRPLYFLSDAEIELYARLVGISGSLRERDSRVQDLFEKFIRKNPNLEINIVNALSQLYG
jgi:hypothetical protein